MSGELSIYAEIALVIFLAIFLAILIYIYGFRHRNWERARHLPLEGEPEEHMETSNKGEGSDE